MFEGLEYRSHGSKLVVNAGPMKVVVVTCLEVQYAGKGVMASIMLQV